MFHNLSTAFTVAILLLQWLCGSFNAITTPSSQPVVKLVFISEEIQQYDLNSTCELILKGFQDISSSLNLQGTAIEWKENETPYSTWQKFQENIIEQNASAVISFLPPKKNYLLVDALSKSVIPIIGLQSLTEEFYKSHQVRRQTDTHKNTFCFSHSVVNYSSP